MARIRDGDEEAFERLYRTYALALRDFAERYVHVRAEAEGIVQDVFMALWVNRATWEPRNVRSYLYAAVRNRAYDHLRHRDVVHQWQKSASRDDVVQAVSVQDRHARDELAEAVQQAVEQLPERSRTVLLLSRQHDLTYSEIAAVLDISVKTVESNMGRAFRHLREALAPYMPGLLFVATQLA